MKAAIVNQKGILEIWNIPMPEIGPYDALCRISFGATCSGTDNRLMQGKHPYPVTFPTILGHESVGRVEKIGSKVKNFQVGDLVSRVGCPSMPGIASNWGGFAEYGIARDHWEMCKNGLERSNWERYRVNQVVRAQIDEKVAPMIITWRETLSYSKRLGLGKDSHVLIVGSGANALAFAAHAINLGGNAVIVGSRDKEAIFRKLHVSGFFDYKSEDLTELVNRFCVNENWAGFDFIIDSVGSSSTTKSLISMLSAGGWLAVYGWNDREDYTLNPFTAINSFKVYSAGYDEEETNEEVQSMILRGQLNAKLWYDLENPVLLDNIADAYHKLISRCALKYLIKL